MLRLAPGLVAGTLMLVLAIFVLGVSGGFAATQRCGGRVVEASWYGTESGSRTATGERFDGKSFTAAMPSRRHFGEHYRVTSIKTGKAVKVRINDLGPAKWTGRGIDLAHAAAAAIGLIHDGHGKVCLERIG